MKNQENQNFMTLSRFYSSLENDIMLTIQALNEKYR